MFEGIFSPGKFDPVAEFQKTVHAFEMLDHRIVYRNFIFTKTPLPETIQENRSNFQRYLAIACDGRGDLLSAASLRPEAEDY